MENKIKKIEREIEFLKDIDTDLALARIEELKRYKKEMLEEACKCEQVLPDGDWDTSLCQIH